MSGDTTKPDPLLNKELSSLLVHGGTAHTSFDETCEAIFMTSGYVYKTAEEAEQAFLQDGKRYVYSRFSNPTVAMFEERLRRVEGAGDHVLRHVVPRDIEEADAGAGVAHGVATSFAATPGPSTGRASAVMEAVVVAATVCSCWGGVEAIAGVTTAAASSGRAGVGSSVGIFPAAPTCSRWASKHSRASSRPGRWCSSPPRPTGHPRACVP